MGCIGGQKIRHFNYFITDWTRVKGHPKSQHVGMVLIYFFVICFIIIIFILLFLFSFVYSSITVWRRLSLELQRRTSTQSPISTRRSCVGHAMDSDGETHQPVQLVGLQSYHIALMLVSLNSELDSALSKTHICLRRSTAGKLRQYTALVYFFKRRLSTHELSKWSFVLCGLLFTAQCYDFLSCLVLARVLLAQLSMIRLVNSRTCVTTFLSCCYFCVDWCWALTGKVPQIIPG